MASVPVPPSIIACAKKPRRPTFFNHGGATASAQGAPEPNVSPLPPCTFVADARSRTSEPQVWCLWNFLVTACQTWLDVYKSRNNTVKKQPMLDHFDCAPASFIQQQKAISLVLLGSSRGIRCFQQQACRMPRRHPSTQ